MADLAERSADLHYRRISTFVKAYFATRKLDEFATDLIGAESTRPVTGEFTVGEVLALLEPMHTAEREKFFGQRVYGLDPTGACPDSAPIRSRSLATEMGLGDFDTYIEMLVALRGRFHRQYLTECLDRRCSTTGLAC